MALPALRPAVLVALVTVAFAAPSFANSGGRVNLAANGCNSCHSGGTAPVVTVTPSKDIVAPGETITVTVTVTTPNGSHAGFNLNPSGGTLGNPGTGVRIQNGEATQSAPKNEDNTGLVTFAVDWTAPTTMGQISLLAWGNSVNGDNDQGGDRAASQTATVSVTCPIWYADQDGDGFGDPNADTAVCTQPANHVADSSDCDDTNADVHPAATEVCNQRDDNCDGSVDEGLTCEMDGGLDAGQPPADAGTETDGGQTDSGTPTDAGQNPGTDAGTSADAGTGNNPDTDAGGCGCSHAPAQSLLALGAIMFVGLTLRRRRSSAL